MHEQRNGHYGVAVCDDAKEPLAAGNMHICPKGLAMLTVVAASF